MVVATRVGGRTKLYLSIITADFVAFTCGLWLAWSSPVLEKLILEDDSNPLPGPIDATESSWIGSLLNVGAVIGPFPFGYLQDQIGRKYTLLIIAVPFIISYFIAAFAKTVILYYVLRIVAGLSIGGGFTVLPTYLAEISDAPVRGLAGTSMNTFICFGLLVSYCIGPYVPIMWFNLICVVFPAGFMITFFLFFPDSPYYLMRKDKREAAEQSLCFLRSKSVADVQAELKEIEDAVKEQKENAASFLDIFKAKGTIKAFIISMMLVAFQQLSGINVVLFYAQTIFEASGSLMNAAIPPIIVGAVQFGTSFVTPLLVDRLGRKSLLLFSTVGIVIAEIPLGVYFYLKDNDYDVESISILPVLTLVLFMITYCLGIGPLPWTVMAEVFPSNIKSAASSTTSAFCWFVSFLLTYFFDSLSDAIGIGGTFWIFAGCTIVAFFFTLVYVPETKGKSFKEIQEILNS